MSRGQKTASPALLNEPALAARKCRECGARVPEKQGFFGFAPGHSLQDGEKTNFLELCAGRIDYRPRKAHMGSRYQPVRFDLCTGCLFTFLGKRLAGDLPTDKPKARPTRNAHADSETLSNLQLSPDEKSAVVRLLRLLRGDDMYWLSYFIQWVLSEDVDSPEYEITPKRVEAILDEIKNFEKWGGYLEALKKKCPAIARHRALAWVPSEKTRTVPESEAEQFAELVRLWRIDHPAPPEGACE